MIFRTTNQRLTLGKEHRWELLQSGDIPIMTTGKTNSGAYSKLILTTKLNLNIDESANTYKN